MRGKTPRQKKELDLDKQRRARWDSQKAARKAIPAAKRAARQIIRKRSNEVLSQTVEMDDAPTAAELAEIERHNRFEKYLGGGKTLREHLKNTQRGRAKSKKSKKS